MVVAELVVDEHDLGPSGDQSPENETSDFPEVSCCMPEPSGRIVYSFGRMPLERPLPSS
jgi:hypothetical protein